MLRNDPKQKVVRRTAEIICCLLLAMCPGLSLSPQAQAAISHYSVREIPFRLQLVACGRQAGISRAHGRLLTLRGGSDGPFNGWDEDDMGPTPIEAEEFADAIHNIRPGVDQIAVEPPPHAQERFRNHDFPGKDVSGDGGVCKSILKHGQQGTQGPQEGDAVYIHFRGIVLSDGREFEDSRRSEQLFGKPFCFTLGKDQVIQAWEIVLPTMKLGELAEIHVHKNYTFSRDGVRLKGLVPYTALNNERSVPDDAEVKFEIELVEFGKGRALVDDGKVRYFEGIKGMNGLWQRRPNVTNGDEVEIRYSAFYRGRQFVSTNGTEKVRLGMGLLPRGLELVLEKEIGLNGTARVRLWGEWSRNRMWNPTLNAVLPDTVHLDTSVELVDWSSFHIVGMASQTEVKCCGMQDRAWIEVNGTVKPFFYNGQLYDDDCDDCDLVALSITGYARGATFVDIPDVEYEIGSGIMPVGIDMGMCKLRERQQGIFTIRPGEHQLFGNARPIYNVFGGLVGPDDTVEYYVIVKQILRRYCDLSMDERVAKGLERKQQGGHLFEIGAFGASLWKYQQAFRCVEYEQTDNPKELIFVKSLDCETIGEDAAVVLLDLKVTLHVNMALVQQKLGDLKAALALCDEALAINPTHVKALFRRSVVKLCLGENDAAMVDMKSAQKVSPNSSSIARQMEVIRRALAADKLKDMRAWGGMFSG